jgi:hypothetical protein
MEVNLHTAAVALIFSSIAFGANGVIYTAKHAVDGDGFGYPLVSDSDGNLYGEAANGGSASCSTYGCGVIFKLAPNGNGGYHPFDEAHIRDLANEEWARTPNPLTPFNHARLRDPIGWVDRLEEIHTPALIIHGTGGSCASVRAWAVPACCASKFSSVGT